MNQNHLEWSLTLLQMGRGAGTAFLYTKLVPSTFPPCNTYGVFYMSKKTIFSLVQVKKKRRTTVFLFQIEVFTLFFSHDCMFFVRERERVSDDHGPKKSRSYTKCSL